MAEDNKQLTGKLDEKYRQAKSARRLLEPQYTVDSICRTKVRRSATPSSPKEHRMGKYSHPKLADHEWLREQYETLGRSSLEIAEDAGCHWASVYKALRRHGIAVGEKDCRSVVVGEKPRRRNGRHHGHTAGGRPSQTYNSWSAMWRRCTLKTARHWKWYGARGITVCERWKSFAAFLKDMGERPEGMTLDRIDGNGNYEPNNCRWATWREQRINRA